MNTKKHSLLCRILLATTLGLGFGTVWAVLALWLGSSMKEAASSRKKPHRESLLVRSDGTPLIESMPLDNLSLTTYRDLGGREQDPVDRKDRVPAIAMPGEQEPPDPLFDQMSWDNRISVFMDEREPAAVWYFMHDGRPRGAGYFVGYERVSNRLIGFIGLSGFRSHPPPPGERIPVHGELMWGNSRWSSASLSIRWRGATLRPATLDLPPRLIYVPSGNQVRLVDLAARTVRTVFEAPEPIEAVGIPLVAAYDDGQLTKERAIHVRSSRKIFTLDREHRIIRTFQIPAEIDPQSPISWYEIGDGRAVADFTWPWSGEKDDEETSMKQIVFRIAADGAIRERSEFALQPGWRQSTRRQQTNQAAICLPVPSLLIPLELYYAKPINARSTSYPAAVRATIRAAWPSWAALAILSSVLAAIARSRSREFGFSRRERTTWTLFVLLLGVPAYVGFLISRRWPAREPCPSCRAVVPRDRGACAACGTPFPEPAPRGIELFARGESSVLNE